MPSSRQRPPPPSQPAGRSATSRAQKAAAKPAKRHIKPATAERTARSRAREAAAKPAKCRPEAATAGLSHGSRTQIPAPALKENVALHGHTAHAVRTGWLPHPLLVRTSSASKGLAVQQSADALAAQADGPSACCLSATGTQTVAALAAPPCSAPEAGTGRTTATGNSVAALATPPQLPLADKAGWKAGQAARARGAEARQEAFKESPLLPALLATAASADAGDQKPAAVDEHGAKHAEHKLSSQQAQQDVSPRGSADEGDSTSRSGRRPTAAVLTGGSLSARTAAWKEFAATQAHGHSMLESKSYCSGAALRAMASRGGSSPRRAVKGACGAAQVGSVAQLSVGDAACSAASCDGSTSDGAAAAADSTDAEGRSKHSSRPTDSTATPGTNACRQCQH